jgi:predicted O-methyltransferase YrrM
MAAAAIIGQRRARTMKSATDAILRTEQATYLDALHSSAVHALAMLGGALANRPVDATARDPLLARMEARAADRGYPISDPEVACLLAIVAKMAQPLRIVELGTNIGYGAIVLARGAGEKARVLTIEYRSELVEEARGYVAEAGLSDRIEVRHGMAIGELEKVTEPIDLLYVDCVKEEYPQYLELAVPKLSRNGIVIADNVLWRGQVARESPPDAEKERVQALRRFNLALVSRPDLCGVVLPLGDGVGLAVRI